MALTAQQQLELTALIVGMYDAAPGYAIMSSIADASIGGASNIDIANSLAAGEEFRSIYPSFLTDAQFVANLVDSLGAGTLTVANEDLANSLLLGLMNGGATRGEVVATAVTALLNTSEADPNFGEAAAIFNNKVEVAQYFTVELQRSGDSLGELQSVLAGVDETQASVDAAKAAALGLGTGGDSSFLTADQDVLNGTSFADLFVADVLQVGGLQVNSLGTGDRLNGGAGNDWLEAQVAIGATFGSTNMAIQPRTTSVENVRLEAMNSTLGGANSTVFVDAQDMTGLDSIGSSWSDGNLIIQNVNTRTDAGDKRLTSEVTIVMEYGGNADTNWDESNLNVYFDQNYLLKDVETTTTSSQAQYWLADQDSTDFDAEPLQRIDRDGIFFTLDGVLYALRDEALVTEGTRVVTWEAYAARLQELLDEQVDGDPDHPLAGIVIAVDNINTRTTATSEFEPLIVSAITLTDENGGVFDASQQGFLTPESFPGSFNVYGQNSADAPVTTSSEFVTSTIQLEKTGRGGDGGVLVVGGMDKNGTNTWEDTQGVEQFNVTVLGGTDLPNSLAGLHSTNNQLQIVNIDSDAVDAITFAPLTIGNSNSAGYGLKDVQILNAAGFSGDLDVTAGITPESLDKYPDLEDGGTLAASDNILFDYSLTGPGNNSLDLEVSQEVIAHEDFLLAITGGTGNDSLTLEMASMSGTLLVNWYADQSALANASIMSGSGDDFIHIPGSGDVIIDAGPGDDLVYTDNSAMQTIANAPGGALLPNGSTVNAHWVTNAVNTNIHDLLGFGAGADYFLYGATLTVTISGPGFSGLAGGIISPAADSFSNGFESTVTILGAGQFVGDHTSINQAIKDAINNHPTLSGVLRAYDGPNNSVFIESLVDGQFNADDLLIELGGPSTAFLTAQSAGQMTLMNNAYGDFINDSDATLATPAAASAYIAGQVGTLGGLYQGVNTSSLATDGEFNPGSPAISEEQTIDFTGFGVPVGGAGDFTVGGITVNVVDGDTDGDIAAAVAAAITGMILANAPTAVVAVANGAVVEITYDLADGDVGEVVVAAGTATVETNLVPVGEEQTVDFGGVVAAANGNFTIGGIIVNVTTAMTSAQIATAAVAAINTSGTMTDPPATGVTAEVDLVLDPAGETIRVFFTTPDGDVAAIVVAPGSSGLGAPLVADNAVAYDPIGTGDPGDIADAPVATDVQGAVAVAPAGVGVVIEGVDSVATTDNTIDMGTGQDVVVLSTSLAANETLEWNGLGNGESSIFNFTVAGASIDMIDFSAYLTSMTSVSGSAASAVDIATTVQAASGVVNANEVVIVPFAALVAAVGVTWANLTPTTLAAALNANTAVWQVGGTGTTLFGTNKAVIMIENPADNGDYKVYELSMTNPAAPTNTGFTVVGLIGVADFGESLTAATAANFV